MKAYFGIDIGSISTKGVVIGEEGEVFAKEYLWTEGDPVGATKRLFAAIKGQMSPNVQIVAVGVTGSARKLIGVITGAAVVKNEITAHAVGTMSIHPDVRTIFEICLLYTSRCV